MSAKKKSQRQLNKREMAGKLLKFFGKKGENWCSGSGNGSTTGCLTDANRIVFKTEGQEKEAEHPMILEIAARLGITEDPWSSIQSWNDEQKWPTIERLLKAIRDRRKFNKAAAEKLSLDKAA